ncbi:MAG: NAD-dependent epimerase/dehydratase family protein [Ignavibacteriales bacterium]|jgi:NAD dependent epimerase/dehydratase family.|nr:MAG: NAD-dependent epimerase/dehydratase family protein [Ignavibacteriaceae bacterium]MBV6444808.1 hypothetical protein [Ignavibacteriaceae bacterium]MBW7873381.1 NAD-dependent epimerase/dehydratase family protein [Ignavibacteria bacterium]MCZ2142071.1 NAD-dependent epimerase/dehydratase family protein [Ignavibacteriales bacterium]OQY71660.1 MAG: hypothetical protein B6D45_09870 [Ignavibacteriales bacterium UTCHB3]
MSEKYQTILGGGGAIGEPLARELTAYTDKIRIAARNPKKINETDRVLKFDLLNKESTRAAVKGSEIVYLVAGLKYSAKVWQQQWGIVLENVLSACKEEGAKLVFFDNVYSYGKVEGEMTEETPLNPCSKKGEVRAKLNIRLNDEYTKGNLQAAVVKAADFYGPRVGSSLYNLLVLNNMVKGKKAMWMNNPAAIHSFTYTPDAAKATAMVGNTPDAYNQVWHAPTDTHKITAEEMVRLTAGLLGVEPKIQVLGNAMLRLAGIFQPTVMEMVEMTYQTKYDYIFNSSKFMKAFNFSPTPYAAGIAACVDSAR